MGIKWLLKGFFHLMSMNFELFIIIVFIGIIFWPLAVFMLIAHIIDYRILKNYYLKRQKWGLNICCGNTDGGGVNADIVERDVPNFILVTSIYRLPFKDKEFKNALCSHTMEHVESPGKFFSELKRVSEKVSILVPPVWDIGCVGHVREHKWQFLTLLTMHTNSLPRRIKLPFWWYQKRFGQVVSDSKKVL
ncbi:methyltransferase domain-containing protein [Candidatus Woesearchaeota archaeon]|nr:methyltransferase domain-containing protein [Candidatus Woesearchaeota archaeon]